MFYIIIQFTFCSIPQIQIEIIHSYNIACVFDRDLIMCESDVYFETYRHVYSVLKSFTEETFPMKNYIIDVDVSFYLIGLEILLNYDLQHCLRLI